MSPRQKALLKEARRIIADAKSTSIQPRFDAKTQDNLFISTVKWAKEAFETTPPYAGDSRKRSQWLNQFWVNEPYLAGIINSVVQVDRNRGWSLVGGRNQVMRFTDILHNWQVQPGRASWREGVGAMAQAFYTTDMGGLCEVGRQFKGGPMMGAYHLDPTRCVLTPKYDYPLRYYPPRARMIELAPTDYMRVASAINIDENFNGLGYSALSRCIELAITMVSVFRHDQEMLFARAPKGLLLLKGISQQTWANAMAVRDATLDNREQEWFGSVAVLATSGRDDVDAKLVALSQLPTGFDQKIFTDLLIYGYALCFGYDPREFWPVSSGALGTATETEAQHRKATVKGGNEFCLGLQEELQGNLPDTLHFDFDARDASVEMAEAALQLAQVQAVTAMLGIQPEAVLSKEQALTLLAEQGIIPREWTVVEEDVEATDTEDADSPDSNVEDVPGTEGTPAKPTDEQAAQQARYLQMPEVQRSLHDHPDEPLIEYHFDGRCGRIRELSFRRIHKTVHPIAEIMKRLAAQVEAEDLRPLPPRVIVQEKPVEEKPSMMDWIRSEFQAIKAAIKPAEPMNLTINNPPAASINAQPSSVQVQTYVDGKLINDPEEEARKQQALIDELSKIMKENQNTLTGELTEYLKANQKVLTNDVLADLKKNQAVLATEVLDRLQVNMAAQERAVTSEKKVKTKGILDAIRRLANGK